MDSLNWSRIFLGGLLAGLVINLVDVPNSVLLVGPKLQALLQQQQAVQSKFVPPYFLAIHFALGIAALFLYAVSKGTLGPGWVTAVVVSGLLILVQRLFTLGQVFLGQLTLDVFFGLSWSIVLGTLLGAAVGTWFYDRPL